MTLTLQRSWRPVALALGAGRLARCRTAPPRSNIRAATSASSARSRPAAAPTCWCASSPSKLRPVANRTIIVENRAGAGGNIAIEYVARSKPDGYTIFIHAGSAVAASMHLFKNPPVDVGKAIAGRRDDQPAAVHARGAMRKVPYKTVAELTAAMKKKGDKASYAAAAPTGRIMGEIYKQAAGLKAVEVNYKTAPDSRQRHAERRRRLRHARSGVLAGAGARRPAAHPRGQHRQASRGQA